MTGASRDPLTLAASAYLAANLLHGADHVRQHMAGLTPPIRVGGGVLTLTAVAVLLLVRRKHPSAPLAATVAGFASAILVSASHLAPHWSVLSDSYVDDIHPDVLSWLVVLLEIATAAVLGFVGLRATAVPDRVGART